MGDDILHPEEQLEALATLSLRHLLLSRGMQTFDCRKHLSVSRADMVAFFRHWADKAEALLPKITGQRKFLHDVVRLEKRQGRYVIYWIDHDTERFHQWYESLDEAAADYVAEQFAYAYPDAKVANQSSQPTRDARGGVQKSTNESGARLGA